MEKGEMLVTSIFSFFQDIFSLMRELKLFCGKVEFVICQSFELKLYRTNQKVACTFVHNAERVNLFPSDSMSS